ncbi:MAG: hypothetical protein QM765_33635 [Myxococcales bacterium]
MALSDFQRYLCRLLADERKRSGESYVAGGLALNEMLSGRRRSHDIDLFHDAQAALATSWANDRGKVVLDGPHLARATPTELPGRSAQLGFHEGRLRGAFPDIREPRKNGHEPET